MAHKLAGFCYFTMEKLYQNSPHAPSVAQKMRVTVELTALLVAISHDQPRVLTLPDMSQSSQTVGDAKPTVRLPSGPLESRHRSLQQGLRAWVSLQTHHPLGYVEQLYSFADRDRIPADDQAERVISLSYLGLTREQNDSPPNQDLPAIWQDWYRYFPWEDFRHGAPVMIHREIFPKLREWVKHSPSLSQKRERLERLALAFNLSTQTPPQDQALSPIWDEELVLDRYEILYEAGMVAESHRRPPDGEENAPEWLLSGDAMSFDHRRILATGMGRLRAKIKYRPVVFELMPENFTLTQLQRAVEALSGRRIHTQNFRRLIKQQNLLEETGENLLDTGGRPARVMRAAGKRSNS